MTTSEPTPVLQPGHTYRSITEKVSGIPLTQLKKTPRGWLFGFFIVFLGTMLFLYAVTILFIYGVGIFGINIPVGWGFDIVNFVWWIGIGHAGTLISAILLLFRQEWRTSINRFAEAMTIFAVMQAGLFPILHLGRPWLFYLLMPYPNSQGLWPGFRSPLVWDLFAILTYLAVSFLFWFMGLVPDLASMRDRATNKLVGRIYGILSLGWRNSARHWHHYQAVYFLMAALATPLVVSVHSIVSLDFAYGVIPGWHSTIFPPYFVAGAVFSGFAMVLTLMIPLRKAYHLEDFITMRHLENMAKIMLCVGLVVAYGYLMENFWGWFGGSTFERFNTIDRYTGAYAPLYWGLLFCNVIIPQLIWFKKIRTNIVALFGIALLVNVGMWLERFMIIVQSLSKDFIPSSWHLYAPTIWDIATFAGTIGFFLTLIFLFIRVLPSISIFELRELAHRKYGSAAADESSKDAPAD